MRIYCGMQLSYANLNYVNSHLSPCHPRGDFFSELSLFGLLICTLKIVGSSDNGNYPHCGITTQHIANPELTVHSNSSFFFS